MTYQIARRALCGVLAIGCGAIRGSSAAESPDARTVTSPKPGAAPDDSASMPPESAPLPSVPSTLPEAPPVPQKKASRLLAKLSATATYDRIVDESFFSGGVELQIGAQSPTLGGGGRAMIRGGRTMAGLPVVWFSVLGGVLEFRAGNRVRLGLGLDLGYLIIYRATQGSPLASPTFTAYAESTVDLYRPTPRAALYLGVRVGLDAVLNVTAEQAVGPTVSIGPGYRF